MVLKNGRVDKGGNPYAFTTEFPGISESNITNGIFNGVKANNVHQPLQPKS